MGVLVHPDFYRKLKRVEDRAAAEGIRVIWRYGYRPVAYQQELLDCWNDPTPDEKGPYACRRRRGLVARPATPGLGTHNWASGVDFGTVPTGKYERVGQIAEEEGLRWGGRFKKNYDPVHLDDRAQHSLEELKARFDESILVEIG